MLHSTLQTGCAEHRPVPAWSTAYRNGVDVHQRRPFSCRFLSPHRRGRADRRLLQCRATSAHEQLVREVLKDSRQHRAHETDVVVIGSGIGGLCCAAMLAKYGKRVTLCESHTEPGGAAHAFEHRGFTFDSGPSFFAGLAAPKGTSINPLKQVLDAVGEDVPCKTYDRWISYTPDGKSFPIIADGNAYASMIREQGGEEAHAQWKALEPLLQPLQEAAGSLPALALRADLGAALTLAPRLPALAKAGLVARDLTAPFSQTVNKVVTSPWLRKLMDLECFVLSGMLAKDTICAEMAMMLSERNSGTSSIDYPLGGTGTIARALMHAIVRLGGRVMLGAHVDEIVVEGGRARGVRLEPHGSKAGDDVITARQAVVSNASIWDTQKLLGQGVAEGWKHEAMQTPSTDSFMHLHLGIDSTGLPHDFQGHHLVINDWEDLAAPQNVCVISFPTQFDPSLAPEGKGVVHAYVAANEPYDNWRGMDRRSQEYKDKKEERSQVLWQALERAVPDIRARTELKLVGTPLTHQRYLNRHDGVYGAAISAAKGSFPGPQTPISGLYRCGDSTAPGIGVPAAAASGLICANTLAPVWSHLSLLRSQS